eukprot:6414583-Amphidinium_carterae.1
MDRIAREVLRPRREERQAGKASLQSVGIGSPGHLPLQPMVIKAPESRQHNKTQQYNTTASLLIFSGESVSYFAMECNLCCGTCIQCWIWSCYLGSIRIVATTLVILGSVTESRMAAISIEALAVATMAKMKLPSATKQ